MLSLGGEGEIEGRGTMWGGKAECTMEEGREGWCKGGREEGRAEYRMGEGREGWCKGGREGGVQDGGGEGRMV